MHDIPSSIATLMYKLSAQGYYRSQTFGSYLQEPRDEARWQPLVAPEVLLLEICHDVVRLLPEVHNLLLPSSAWAPSPRLVSHGRVFLYLVIRVALEKQHVDYGQLVDVSVSLELLSNPRTDDRHWKGNIVHRLDLWCLRVDLVRQPTAFAYSMGCLAFNRGTIRPLPQHTARTHSRYADVTRLCASPQLAAAWRSVLAGKRSLLGVLTLARLARELRRRDTHSGWTIVRGV